MTDWATLDKVDLGLLFSPDGIVERGCEPLENAVRLLSDRLLYMDLPQDTPDATVTTVRRLEQAVTILQAGLALQSQRYDERIYEVERLEVANDDLRREIERQASPPGGV